MLLSPGSLKRPDGHDDEILKYDEYLRSFRTEPPTLQPYYIADGVQIMLPMPGLRHQRTILRLLVLLHGDTELPPIVPIPAPLDTLIQRDPLCTRQADILVMSRERFESHDVISMPGPVTVAPDLVIEVLVPTESPREIKAKMLDFQKIGVREGWLVDIATETVRVLSLASSHIQVEAVYERGQEADSLALPGLELPVEKIFKP